MRYKRVQCSYSHPLNDTCVSNKTNFLIQWKCVYRCSLFFRATFRSFNGMLVFLYFRLFAIMLLLLKIVAVLILEWKNSSEKKVPTTINSYWLKISCHMSLLRFAIKCFQFPFHAAKITRLKQIASNSSFKQYTRSTRSKPKHTYESIFFKTEHESWNLCSWAQTASIYLALDTFRKKRNTILKACVLEWMFRNEYYMYMGHANFSDRISLISKPLTFY